MNTIIAAGLTDKGPVRQQNEDNYLIGSEQGIFIVSDGMGGHAAGELASKIVVEVLPALLSQRRENIQNLSTPAAIDGVLETLITLSNYVRDESSKHPGFSRMGATVVLVLFRDSRVLIAYMGDSRAYMLRQGRLTQLTKDHSIVQILVDNGELKPEDAATHPARSQITRYVGMKGEALPEFDVLELESEDRFLLCTDGLSGMLPGSKITELLHANLDPGNACRALVDAANAAGGRDNTTVIVVNYSR